MKEFRNSINKEDAKLLKSLLGKGIQSAYLPQRSEFSLFDNEVWTRKIALSLYALEDFLVFQSDWEGDTELNAIDAHKMTFSIEKNPDFMNINKRGELNEIDSPTYLKIFKVAAEIKSIEVFEIIERENDESAQYISAIVFHTSNKIPFVIKVHESIQGGMIVKHELSPPKSSQSEHRLLMGID